MANYPGVISGNSLFSGVLQSLTGLDGSAGTAAPAAANGATANVASSASGQKFNVIGRVSQSPSAEFASPLPSGTISQAFGPSTESLEPSATVNGVTYAHYHNGIDMAAPLGSTVRAAGAGLVTYAGRQSDGAVVVKVRHDDGYVSLYAHLDPVAGRQGRPAGLRRPIPWQGRDDRQHDRPASPLWPLRHRGQGHRSDERAQVRLPAGSRRACLLRPRRIPPS